MRTQSKPSSWLPVLSFVVLTLGISTLTFAQPRLQPSGTLLSPVPEPGAVPELLPTPEPKPMPLLYQLPSALVRRSAENPDRLLTLQVSRDGSALVRETIELPTELADNAAVAVLGNHAGERERLERMETVRPGSLRLEVGLGDRAVDELSWQQLEKRQTAWAADDGTPVGSTRQVDVFFGGALRSLSANAIEDGKDPDCVQYCDDERFFCYTERCDPRGSCDFCETYYRDCVLSCPDICIDPKQVYNYYVPSYVGSSYEGVPQCFKESSFTDSLYWLRDDLYLVQTYERTEYCDGSYSDRFVAQGYQVASCWERYIFGGCQGATQYPPFPYPVCSP